MAELNIRGRRMIDTFKGLVQEGKIDPSLYIFNTSNASDKVYHLHPFLDDGSIMDMMDAIMESFPKETK